VCGLNGGAQPLILFSEPSSEADFEVLLMVYRLGRPGPLMRPRADVSGFLRSPFATLGSDGDLRAR
jgi:hypothetical protein